MRIDRRSVLLVAAAVLLALLFARLGWWQLERHAERSALNQERRARMALASLSLESPADLAALPPASELDWRPVELRGRWDYQNEIVLRPRSHEGRPAVELLTPLLLSPDTAVLVLRGWLPSPDALHAPIREARGPEDSAVVRGLVRLPPESEAGRRDPTVARVTVDGEEHLALRRPRLETAVDHLPYHIVNQYVRQTHDEAPAGPLRPLPRPALEPGPHLSYAIQWFAFALIALVGTGALLRRGR